MVKFNTIENDNRVVTIYCPNQIRDWEYYDKSVFNVTL